MFGNAAEATATLWGSVGRYYIKGGSWCHPWWWVDAGSYMATYTDPSAAQFSATVGFRLACDAAESKPRQGDLKAPTILPAKKKLSRTPKLKIRTGKPIDFGQAPTNEVSFLVCWDPAQGPSSDKDIWILWNKRSTDGGKTWNQCKFLPHTAQQLSDGTIITLGQDHLPTPNKSGHVYIQVSEDGWKTTKQTLARLELPQAKIRNGRMRIYFF